MVSFTTIAQGIALVSVLMMRAEAAPAAGSSSSKDAVVKSNVTLSGTPIIISNDTLVALPIDGTVDLAPISYDELPPIIPSRVIPVTNPLVRADLDVERRIIAENTELFIAAGGNITQLQRRADPTNVASTGLTMVVPANAPVVKTFLESSSVIAATTTQINNFKFLSSIAASAYCDSVIVSKKWTCNYCTKYASDVKLVLAYQTATHKMGGALLRSDTKKEIYVVFRGSSNIKNWLDNLEFIRGSYPPVSGASVHIGFYNAYKEASTYFYTQFLAQHKLYPTYKVVVTGHSLGGAQAVLAGVDLYQRVATLTKSNLSIYTNGCPRIGNDDFAYYVANTGIPYYRSVHDRDIVPHVPPQALGYLHPGIETWTRTATTAQICNSKIETSTCSNSIVPFTSFEDHRTYYGMDDAC